MKLLQAINALNLVKLPKMTKYEIGKLIREQMICRIAFRGAKYPYIAPFQYVFIKGSLYFHFTDYGRKMKLLMRNEPVCVEIETAKSNMSEYCFVVLAGKLKIVTDPQERATAIKKMAKEGKQKLAENFLATHGFKKEDGWTSFTPDKSIIMVKLEKVFETIALKSP